MTKARVLDGAMCEAGPVRIAVLGPLAMWAADRTPLDARGVRLRGLLARLALSAGRPVSVETLVDGLWGSEAPSANALQSLVSRLRASLSATRVEHLGPVRTGRLYADHRPGLCRRSPVRGAGTAGTRGNRLDPEMAWTLLTQADKL